MVARRREAQDLVLVRNGLGTMRWLAHGAERLRGGERITSGPYSVVKHPLYTDGALLVLPWIGFLSNTWLGAVIGIVVYVGSRRFAPEEEAVLSETPGGAWDEYCSMVKIPWLETLEGAAGDPQHWVHSGSGGGRRQLALEIRGQVMLLADP